MLGSILRRLTGSIVFLLVHGKHRASLLAESTPHSFPVDPSNPGSWSPEAILALRARRRSYMNTRIARCR
ncbi:hypothetical protein MESS4_p40053 [Mesorhizobium sp. STM 4661]|nr:hypothetical protein MESS4_p40053 [Mesorhizobium sp. STM 4661]